MLTRVHLWFLSKSLDITDKLMGYLNHKLSIMAVRELSKAIEGKSSILIYDPPCALDEALEDGATRKSLKTWGNPHNVTW